MMLFIKASNTNIFTIKIEKQKKTHSSFFLIFFGCSNKYFKEFEAKLEYYNTIVGLPKKNSFLDK